MNEKDQDYLFRLMTAFLARKDPSLIVSFASVEGRNGIVEDCTMRNPVAAVEYARFVVRGRWPEAEKYIAESDNDSLRYAEVVIKGRFALYEKEIESSPRAVATYCRTIGERVPELEGCVLRGPIMTLFEYMKNVVKGRFLEAEDRLMEKPKWLWEYADRIVQGKLPDEMHTAMVMHSYAEPSNRSVKKYFVKYGV